MTSPRGPLPTRRRQRVWTPAAGLALALALLLSACGGPTSGADTATKKTCRQVAAVLADQPCWSRS